MELITKYRHIRDNIRLFGALRCGSKADLAFYIEMLTRAARFVVQIDTSQKTYDFCPTTFAAAIDPRPQRCHIDNCDDTEAVATIERLLSRKAECNDRILKAFLSLCKECEVVPRGRRKRRFVIYCKKDIKESHLTTQRTALMLRHNLSKAKAQEALKLRKLGLRDCEIVPVIRGAVSLKEAIRIVRKRKLDRRDVYAAHLILPGSYGTGKRR
jgi:hypothetical protein